jgi:hypothetical protein
MRLNGLGKGRELGGDCELFVLSGMVVTKNIAKFYSKVLVDHGGAFSYVDDVCFYVVPIDERLAIESELQMELQLIDYQDPLRIERCYRVDIDQGVDVWNPRDQQWKLCSRKIIRDRVLAAFNYQCGQEV